MLFTPRPHLNHTHLPSQPAVSCSDIYISTTGGCSLGSRLATDVDVSSCLPVICYTIDVWSKAAYGNASMMIVGTGYDATCGPLTKDGDLGDAVCVSSSVPTPKPKPTPKPTPSTPTPTPQPAWNCSDIYITTMGGCSFGSRLASLEHVSSCLPVICATMDVWEKAAYADTSMMIVGSGYNATCGPLRKDGELFHAVCVSPSVPTPKPTPSTPTPTPQPAGNCSDIIISTNDVCYAGMRFASPEEVSSCMAPICAAIDVYAKAAYADTSMMIVGSGYDATCGQLPKDGDFRGALCVLSSAPRPKPKPTPMPTPPAPIPKPTHVVNCYLIYVRTTGGCYAGTRLATDVEVSSCLPVICATMDRMDVWAKAAYADTSMMVVGSGYSSTCGPLPKDGDLGGTVCVDVTIPTPWPEPYATPQYEEDDCPTLVCVNWATRVIIVLAMVLIATSASVWQVWRIKRHRRLRDERVVLSESTRLQPETAHTTVVGVPTF